ncbi:MAG: hypothetical protein EPN93_17400 [Spirochaetes bacterium]|nr:MAG: hypothetical protein EPN93_17400 [Spirochaetota bacterium]
MRTRIKTQPKPDTKTMMKEAAALPVFNEKPKPGRIRPFYFWTAKGGAFSKRGFFFSLFAFIAILYIVICASGLITFSDGLGAFILGCNAAFGLNYFKNEANKREMFPWSPDFSQPLGSDIRPSQPWNTSAAASRPAAKHPRAVS